MAWGASTPRAALDDAVRKSVLSRADADAERVVLDTWEQRLGARVTSGMVQTETLREPLRRESRDFANLARTWLALANLPPPVAPIPLVFVPSPGRGTGGGGANGGVIVIEVPEQGGRGTLTTVAHELVHALLAPRATELDAAAQRCGLDQTTMSEAIAYSAAPGLFAYDEGMGSLEAQATAAQKTPDHPYARFTRLALAVRPVLRDELRRAQAGTRGRLEVVLAAVCDAAASKPASAPKS